MRDESGVARGVHITAPRMSQWRTSLLKVQKGATARIELATSCTQSRNHTTRPRRLRALRRTAGSESERGKTEKGACRARLANRNPKCPASYFIFVRPTAQICDSSTPGRTAEKNFSRATVTFLPRRWFARPWVEAGRTSAQCAPRRPPFARVDAGHYLASVRPLEPRGYGVRSVAREGGEISTRGVVCRSGLSRCDGDLCPADGVRGARGDGSVLGNPPRLQLAACLVSRPRFRSRRPRRRASTSRLSAQCKVATGARAT